MNTRNLLSFTTLFIVFLTFATTASAMVRSCDSLSYSSNSDQFSGDQLTCAFTSDFATDAIQLDLSNQIPNGQADQSLELSVTKQTSKAVYGFRSTGLEPVTLFHYEEDSVDVLCSDSVATKQAKVEHVIGGNAYDIDGSGDLSTADYYAKELLNWNGCEMRTGYIDTTDQLASVAEIDSSPNIVWETTWRYQAGSKSDTVTITNGDVGAQESTSIGRYTTITWTGNLQWDEPLEVINENNYNTWHSDISTLSHNVEMRVKRQITTNNAVTEAVNREAFDAVAPHTSSEFHGGTFDGTSLSGATLNIPFRIVY